MLLRRWSEVFWTALFHQTEIVLHNKTRLKRPVLLLIHQTRLSKHESDDSLLSMVRNRFFSIIAPILRSYLPRYAPASYARIQLHAGTLAGNSHPMHL